MSIIIRDVREHELDLVLALNNAAGPGILPMDAGKNQPKKHRQDQRADHKDGAPWNRRLKPGSDLGCSGNGG